MIYILLLSSLEIQYDLFFFFCIYVCLCACACACGGVGRTGGMWLLQELDESGAEVFTLLLPSGTPLPARRHCILSGDGKLSSVRLDIYQRFVSEQPEQLAKVRKGFRSEDISSLVI